jgi:OmcA/MtrC family decaheme c-type cytochrome
MRLRKVAPALIALLLGVLAGCGGGGGGGSVAVPVQPAVTGGTILSITVNSPPVVTFVVNDSSGRPVPGLKLFDPAGSAGDPACGGSNVTFAIAKFVGSNWQSLISRQRYAADDLSDPNAPKRSVIEGTVDPKPTATITNPATAVADPSTRVVGILEEANGVYTYRFATDVTTTLLMANAVAGKNVALGKVANDGHLAVKDRSTPHRVALQLCYRDPVTGATVKANPYMDFTLGADGTAVPSTDAQGQPVSTRTVVDRASCNECHQNFAQHGGNRVEPNYCVMCHNPGSADFETGNPIDFKLMVHKFHMGKRLTRDYAVRSAVARKDTAGVITGVLYPQDQRNCVKCHDGSATAAHRTAQGDNWKTRPSKNACLACHDDYKTAGSKWQLAHAPYGSLFASSVANPDATPDSVCQSCHNDAGTGVAKTIAKAHEVPEWVMGGNYRLNLWSIGRNPDNSLTVEYSVSNPNTGADYDLLDPALASRFSSLSLLFGWNTTDYANDGGNVRGQPFSHRAATDASVRRVGASSRFRLTSAVLPAAASGTVAVAFQGRINEAGLRVPVQNQVKYFAMSGNAVERRQVVSAEKCNACHGRFIGYASLTTFNPGLGAHGANRNDPQVCVICHNGNNPLNGTVVSGGQVTQYAESADFKRMIHKMHAEQEENFPVWPKAERTTSMGSVIYAGLKRCDACHVDDSHLRSKSALGTSVTYAVDTSTDSTNAAVTDADASDNLVISPRASTCSSCHNSDGAKVHMRLEGGAAFGTVTQGALATGTAVLEQCDGCHLPGALSPVDAVHAGN